MHVHLVTTGTSIVANALKKDISEDIKNTLIKAKLATPGSPEDLELKEHVSITSRVFNEVYTIVVKDPYTMSAELNSLKYFLENGLVDKVLLLSTDTGVGYFCSSIVKKYLSEKAGIDTEVKVVKGFGVVFEEGLMSLLDTACKLISEYKKAGHKVYVCATAGFKPETSFLIIAAFLLNVDSVYYIHENFREHVELPSIPLTVKAVYLNELKKIYEREKLHGFLPADEIEENVLKELSERRLVTIEDQKKVKLKKWIKVLLPYIES